MDPGNTAKPANTAKPGKTAGAGVVQGQVGPFVTFVEHRRPDGVVADWESRRHRKHPCGHVDLGLDLVGA